MEGIKCVLLDIEGTICPISFVKETLFPYALKALPVVLASKWHDEEFKPYSNAFPEDVRTSPEKLQAHVEDLTKRDVKVAYLKNLQGYLWENGYRTGAYSTPLFSDVAPRLKAWASAGFQLAIYSSGSVFAQKLLFGHVNTNVIATNQKRKRSDEAEVEHGDESLAPPPKKHAGETEDPVVQQRSSDDASLLESGKIAEQQLPDSITSKSVDRLDVQDATEIGPIEDLQYLITGWFDTTNAGPKIAKSSYDSIAKALKCSPVDILFLSDNVQEVDAALIAGMHSIVVERPGNAPLPEGPSDRLRIVHSLGEISLVQGQSNGSINSPKSKTPTRRQSQRLRARNEESK